MPLIYIYYNNNIKFYAHISFNSFHDYFLKNNVAIFTYYIMLFVIRQSSAVSGTLNLTFVEKRRIGRGVPNMLFVSHDLSINMSTV